MATPVEYQLDIPDSDGALGEPQNTRGLSEKCVQIGAFVGEIAIRGSIDGTDYPVIQSVTDDGTDPDGSLVPISFQVRTVKVERVTITGDVPPVALAGLLL